MFEVPGHEVSGQGVRKDGTGSILEKHLKKNMVITESLENTKRPQDKNKVSCHPNSQS
jgi:hypothetical protein